MKSNHNNLTSEIFCEICEGSFTPDRVTQEMLDLASTISRKEAKRILRDDGVIGIPVDDMWMDQTICKIEESVPRCRDRHIVAILKVAKVWGDDGWDDDRRVALY